ncbi:MAG: hypothetical protein KC636_09115 [Myxococcales bacterium]|nr:hypothetical protein [Myxococcales bacterium]
MRRALLGWTILVSACGPTAYETTTDGESYDPDATPCEIGEARLRDRYRACGIELGPDDSGGVEMECTEELGALILCYADCVDAASCGAFDASDLDAATMYGDCVLACPGG